MAFRRSRTLDDGEDLLHLDRLPGRSSIAAVSSTNCSLPDSAMIRRLRPPPIRSPMEGPRGFGQRQLDLGRCDPLRRSAAGSTTHPRRRDRVDERVRDASGTCARSSAVGPGGPNSPAKPHMETSGSFRLSSSFGGPRARVGGCERGDRGEQGHGSGSRGILQPPAGHVLPGLPVRLCIRCGRNVTWRIRGLRGPPAFDEPVHVAAEHRRPRALMARINEALDRRWLTNNGPLVQEFERRLQDLLGVRHVLVTCNARWPCRSPSGRRTCAER